MFHVEHINMNISEIKLIFVLKEKNTYTMFNANNQPELFTFESELSKKQRELLESSKKKWFYYLILWNIKESDFKALYSDKASRPNVPVNILVSALILKEFKGLIQRWFPLISKNIPACNYSLKCWYALSGYWKKKTNSLSVNSWGHT